MDGRDDLLGLPPNRFHPLAWLIGEPEIGEGTWIGAFCVVDGSGGLRIGAGCDISAGSAIYTHSSVARCLSGRSAPVERRPVSIGDRVHVGANAVILMGSEIGRHSVVGAGAVVTEGTIAPPYSLLLGVPARVVENGARRFMSERGGDDRDRP